MVGDNFVVLRSNMFGMIKYSLIEYEEYRKGNDVILLQPAGEKIFGAVENFVSLKYGVQVDSYYEAKSLLKNDRDLRFLLYDAQKLHRFFYNGETEMDVRDAEKLYLKVKNKIRSLAR
jgi:hypothetical protein